MTIRTFNDLTPETLTALLHGAGLLANNAVSKVDYAPIGTGKLSTNLRLELTFDSPTDELPHRCVAKLAAPDETTRMMAGAQGAYGSEVSFYRELAPQCAIAVPQVYVTELSDDQQYFFILMSDLSPAKPGSNLDGLELEQIELAAKEAAHLAAAFYGEAEADKYPFVLNAAKADGGEFGQTLLIQYWPQFKERFGSVLSSEQLTFGDLYVQNHAKYVQLDYGPRTIVHGDYRAENMLFHKGKMWAVDWQTIAVGSALTDLSYLLGGSVDPLLRREHEGRIVEYYCEHFNARGHALSYDQAWSQYRHQAMHGLMITILGACFSAPEERSDRMFSKMIRGHLQHCLDVNAEEFIF